MRGTCEWIFKDERFQMWKNSRDLSTALLWIHARAGMGKSTLAATIIQHLLTVTRGTTDSCVYFFCRSDDEAKKTPHAILRSTAYWLSQRNDTIRKRLMELYNNYPDLRIEELPLPSLWDRLFMQCICDRPSADTPPFRIYWIIDALNECETNQRMAFTKMLTELSEEHCGVCFRLLFLSRFVLDITKVAETMTIPTIEMRTSDNACDIQQYIETNIRTSSLGRLHPDDRRRVIETLKERGNGSFLWIKFMMEELAGRRSMRSIEVALNEIPADRSLEDMYQLTMNSLADDLDREDLDIAREIFVWTMCAPRPLSLEELTAALEASMDTKMMDMERTVKETCGSLIEVVQSDVGSPKEVMAAHITLHEFMRSEKATGPFAFSKAEANARIASTCLNYLLRSEFAKPFTVEMDQKMDATVVGMKYPLLNYASRFWSFHLVRDIEAFDPAIQDLILRFLQSRNVLTSIEAIATFGHLAPLSRISEHLRSWLTYVPPNTLPSGSLATIQFPVHLPPEEIISRWSLDFRRIKQRFQHSLLISPRVIHDSLPSFCPLHSMIYLLGSPTTTIHVTNASQPTEWDNRLSMFHVPGHVRAMVCSPVRANIASAVDSSLITIWDAETGQGVRVLRGHKGEIYALAYSKNEEYLASGGKDQCIVLWNVERGQKLFEMRTEGVVYSLAYNYSGDQIASGGDDRVVRVWRMSDDGGKIQHELRGHPGTVYALKYHSDDTQLCSSSDDGLVIVWHTLTGTKLRTIDANLKWMGRLSFHPTRHEILTSSETDPNEIHIWNSDTGTQVSKIHTSSLTQCWRYSPDGKYIVTGHLDGRVRVWDTETLVLLHTIIEDAWSLRFSHSGKYLICLIRYISRWQVRTWDFEEEVLRARPMPHSTHRVVHAVTVNNDNSRLATVSIPYAGSWFGRVKLWDPAREEVLWSQEQVFRRHECVAPGFSPKGRHLGCYDGKEDGGIHLVNVISTEVEDKILIPAWVNLVALAVDVDGRGVAIATREEDFLEDGETNSPPRFFLARRSNGRTRPVDVISAMGTQNSMALSYTADGAKLILAARDFQDSLHLTIWETATRSVQRRVVYGEDQYVWFKMFGGFRLLGRDRIVIHADYMSRESTRRSLWRERMLVLSSNGGLVRKFEAGSSRMTICGDRIIFLDSEYWIVSWDGERTRRHVLLPIDVGFQVSGLCFWEGKLVLVSRMERIIVVEIESLK
jgi:WD40 repeat protein